MLAEQVAVLLRTMDTDAIWNAEIGLRESERPPLRAAGTTIDVSKGGLVLEPHPCPHGLTWANAEQRDEQCRRLGSPRASTRAPRLSGLWADSLLAES